MRVGCDGPGCEVVERDDEAIGWIQTRSWGNAISEFGVPDLGERYFHSIRCAIAFLTQWRDRYVVGT